MLCIPHILILCNIGDLANIIVLIKKVKGLVT